MNIQTIKKTAILVSISFTVLLGSFSYRQYLLKEKAEATLKEKQEKLTAIKNEVREIKQSLERYEKEKEEFAYLLFKERDIPSFLDKISEFAKITTVGITDMKTRRFQEVRVPESVANARKNPGSLKHDENTPQRRKKEMQKILTLAAMPIEIRVQGTFPSLINFLEQLQDYSQLLSISQIEIETSNNYPVLNCRFTLQVYSLKTLEDLKNI